VFLSLTTNKYRQNNLHHYTSIAVIRISEIIGFKTNLYYIRLKQLWIIFSKILVPSFHSLVWFISKLIRLYSITTRFILGVSNVIAHQAITIRHHGTAIYILLYYTLWIRDYLRYVRPCEFRSNLFRNYTWKASNLSMHTNWGHYIIQCTYLIKF